MSQHRLACGDKMGKVYELDNAYTRNFKLKKTCYFAWISEYDKTTALYVYLITCRQSTNQLDMSTMYPSYYGFNRSRIGFTEMLVSFSIQFTKKNHKRVHLPRWSIFLK